MRELLALLETMVGRGGVDALHPRWRVGNLAMPRPLEARWLGPGLGLGSGLGLGLGLRGRVVTCRSGLAHSMGRPRAALCRSAPRSASLGSGCAGECAWA